ncbi:mercury transport protein [Mesorhizobium sp. M0145]|uniref:mercury transport protein n=1 Tax=unclassified Mesorhizobium TaxID=325217 RepID=UPI00333CC6FA
MSDRALVRAGVAGAILAAICCAAPLLAVGLPLAGLGAWLAGAGLVVLPLIGAGLGLVAWGVHHRRATVAGCETKIHKEGVKP